jgi:hypothetical protein
MSRGFKALPYLINPGEVLGFHKDGAEAGECFVLFSLRPGFGREKGDWQVSEGEMEV